jgi:polysaccharide export outer membrane protein
VTKRSLGPALLLVAGCAHSGALPTEAAPVDYHLGPDDLIEVSVWKEPALSAVVPVRPDGKVSLPMAGELPAAGRTVEELRADIARRLAPSVPEPIVSVMVKEVRAARFFVIGEVAHPGAFPLTGGVTVLEAVTVAGGPTEFARKGRIVVLRRPTGSLRPARLRVNFDDVLSGRAPPLPLVPGDTVYVP